MYNVIRECIDSDRIAPAFSLHLAFDLPCISMALPAVAIKKALPCQRDKEGPHTSSLWLPLAPAIVMMFPGPIGVAIVSPHHDGRSAIHHWRRGYHHGRWVCHDYGRRVDDGRRCGSDHDGCRGDRHRQPDTNRDLRPCRGRERQGNSGKADNSDQDKDASKRWGVLHCGCPLRMADRRRPFFILIVPMLMLERLYMRSHRACAPGHIDICSSIQRA